MANTLTKIATQTANGSVNSITFSSIPATYTDLKLMISARSTYATGSVDYMSGWFNGDRNTLYSDTIVTGSGSSTSSQRSSTTTAFDVCSYPNANNTSNVYGSVEIYIPNYAGSNYKQGIIDGVMENNATYSEQRVVTILYRSTNAINSITIYAGSGNYTSSSEFTLYGIKNA